MTNILITGCSSGIGLQTATTLKQNGIKVYASARKIEDVEKLKNLGFETFKLDVRNKDEIKNALDVIFANDKKLDVVFNNAGYGQAGAIEDVSTEVLREQFETNVFGLHELSRQTMKIFRKQTYGKLIQHSSVLGLISLRHRGAYNSSKYAIEGLCDTLRLETLNSNIFISTLNTGPVSSNFRKNALKKFQENIDIENSFFKNEYINEVNSRLNSNDDNDIFTLPSSSVANIVLEIVNSKKPKPRYYITKATYLLAFSKRILSTKILDRLLLKI